jgi:hypothetical protein
MPPNERIHASPTVLDFPLNGETTAAGEDAGGDAGARGTTTAERMRALLDGAYRRGYEAGLAAGLEQVESAGESYGKAIGALWRVNAELLERAREEAEALSVRIVASYLAAQGDGTPVEALHERVAAHAARIIAESAASRPTLKLVVHTGDLNHVEGARDPGRGLVRLELHADGALPRAGLRCEGALFEVTTPGHDAAAAAVESPPAPGGLEQALRNILDRSG